MVKRIRLYLRRRRTTKLLRRLEESRLRLDIYTTCITNSGNKHIFEYDIYLENKRVVNIRRQLRELKVEHLKEKYAKEINTKI